MIVGEEQPFKNIQISGHSSGIQLLFIHSPDIPHQSPVCGGGAFVARQGTKQQTHFWCIAFYNLSYLNE